MCSSRYQVPHRHISLECRKIGLGGNHCRPSHCANRWRKEPRIYKNRARKENLRFASNRKPTIKVIRKAIKKQLGYVRRDLSIAERLFKAGGRLTEK